ncbi:MAG: CPBP family glutamic-type intramembrane protease [Hyphomicrobium sp.]
MARCLSEYFALGPTEAGPLTAGGTLAADAAGSGRDPPLRPVTPARRLWLLLEMAALFGAAPLAMHLAVHGERVPLFLALMPVLALALVLLAADPTFHLTKEACRRPGWRAVLSILVMFLVLGGATAAWTAWTHPDWFLEFPRRRPETYQRVLLVYPLMSVAAQELVYRTFYFHRYGPLFGERRWLGIVVNGVLFGFGHIVVGTTFAVLATTATGLLFAMRYAATRSFWAVFIEHTLWGWLVFTVGLGRYFFTGIPFVR